MIDKPASSACSAPYNDRVTSKRIFPLVAVLAIIAASSWLRLSSRDRDGAPVARQAAMPTASSAFESRESRVWVEEAGTVVALLADDLEGSRHQRFLVLLANGSTILVSHNIDIAPRVPVEKGEEVRLRGEYVWNEKGGLVHWTHHDPKGRISGGWVEHRGRQYR